MAISKQRITLEQFLELPEAEPALEYIDGMVTRKVSPKGRHSLLQWKICDLVNRAAEPSKLGLALPELRTTFGGASHVPDVSFYRWARIAREPSGEIADDFVEPPDIAIEIASPGQGIEKLAERCRWYFERGVPLVLLLVARQRSVTVFRTGVESRVLRGPDRIDLSPFLSDFDLTVQALFDFLQLA